MPKVIKTRNRVRIVVSEPPGAAAEEWFIKLRLLESAGVIRLLESYPEPYKEIGVIFRNKAINFTSQFPDAMYFYVYLHEAKRLYTGTRVTVRYSILTLLKRRLRRQCTTLSPQEVCYLALTTLSPECKTLQFL